MVEKQCHLGDSLKALVDAHENKEHECREYLQHAKEILVEDTVVNFEYVEKERRGASGDSDYIISCKVRDPTGVESVKAYIWELKAPQCYIFEKDTENRIRPAKDLIQAENQLLHYYHELKGSEQFRTEFGVTHSDNVHLGGIIIGSLPKRVQGNYDEPKKKKLFEKALMIRKVYIYDRLGIKLIIWDHIVNFLKPDTLPAQKVVESVYIHAEELEPGKVQISSSP